MKEPTNDELHALAAKWINKTITEEEKSIYIKWYDSNNDHPIVWEGQEQSSDELENRLISDIFSKIKVTTKLKQFVMIITAAALILLVTGLPLLLFKNYRASNKFVNSRISVKPGINNAVLTLSNGKQIDLTTFKSGTITDQTGSKISKDSTGQLKYQANSGSVTNYTVTTPVGTEYHLRLPDGTYVWLNSGSSITYPNFFKPAHERRINLKGEAYFVVKKDRTSPFKVVTHAQEITVLGTHFNVDSYADEAYTKTTLLEGSVSVVPRKNNFTGTSNNALILTPGQQLTLTKNNVVVKEVDTTQAVGWKNGDFVFRNEDIKSVLRRISKWYNVSVKYENVRPITLQPWGGISRKSSLSSVLKMLESTEQIHFKIERRTIIVTN